MPVLVGTSGWQYRDWKGRFYPAAVPQRLWLEHHAAAWQTVEVNAAFYRLPEREVFGSWAARTPGDYVVTTKASRFLSHIKRLREPQEPVARLMDRVAGLGGTQGPLLLQLPPDLQVEAERLDACLSCFPAGTRVAVEPRHASWWVPEVREVLTSHGAALCWADRGSTPVVPLWRRSRRPRRSTARRPEGVLRPVADCSKTSHWWSRWGPEGADGVRGEMLLQSAIGPDSTCTCPRA